LAGRAGTRLRNIGTREGQEHAQAKNGWVWYRYLARARDCGGEDRKFRTLTESKKTKCKPVRENMQRELGEIYRQADVTPNAVTGFSQLLLIPLHSATYFYILPHTCANLTMEQLESTLTTMTKCRGKEKKSLVPGFPIFLQTALPQVLLGRRTTTPIPLLLSSTRRHSSLLASSLQPTSYLFALTP
jgi:hypothetical protein